MFLIVGLGNPGRKYENTRHNVGFMVLDALAQKLGAPVSKLKFKGLFGETFFQGEKVVLLKPHTYMNLSGQSVLDAVNFYRIPPENLLVIYDDMDLPVGNLRLRFKGGTGGHKGMESIVYLLNTHDFPRIRIGIGKPTVEMEAADYVLGNIPKGEMESIQIAVQSAAEAALMVASDGIDLAMNRFNNLEL